MHGNFLMFWDITLGTINFTHHVTQIKNCMTSYIYTDKYGCSIADLGLGVRSKFDENCLYSEKKLDSFFDTNLKKYYPC